jgi:uncharacterized protein
MASFHDSVEVGTIEAIFRYPVKSMRGESLSEAMMGWHGVEGDRRFALRRVDFRGGFPWLTAGRLPDLLHYATQRIADEAGDQPTHVRTPDGDTLPLLGEELAKDVERRCGEPVQMMHLNHGMFDEAAISVIAAGTVDEACRLAGKAGDVRRFRPNILLRTRNGIPFEEDAWVGGRLAFGDEADAPAISVTMRDVRCAMITFDPDQKTRSPELMKAVVRANDNNAGVYGAVIRAGRIAVGQTVVLHAEGAAMPVPKRVA